MTNRPFHTPPGLLSIIAKVGKWRRFATIGLVAIGVALVAGLATARITSEEALSECQQDYRTMQAGLDAYMAYFGLTSIPPGTANDFTKLPFMRGVKPAPLEQQDPGHGPIPGTTTSRLDWAFTWDSSGRVTAISQTGGGPPVPAGCVPSSDDGEPVG